MLYKFNKRHKIKNKYYVLVALAFIAILIPFQAGAAVLDPTSNIQFQITSPSGNEFRVLAGQTVQIPITLAQAPGTTQIVFGQDSYRRTDGPSLGSFDIYGIYVAAKGLGGSLTCVGGCSWERFTASQTSMPATFTLSIPTTGFTTADRDFVILPAIDLNGADVPFGTNALNIRIRTFPTPEALAAAGGAGSSGGSVTSLAGSSDYGVDLGAAADPIAGVLFLVINTIIGFILAIINAYYHLIVGQVIIPLVTILVSIDFSTFSDIVNRGWIIVRDLVNVVFILGLIMIGIAMILRLENYGNRRLIGKLIIMALLVNFSLVIAFGILNVADSMTNTFLGANRAGVINSIFDRLSKWNTSIFSDSWLAFGSSRITLTQSQLLINSLFIAALQLVSLGVFVYMAATLLARFVAIVILLIFSPAAYGLAVLPMTGRVASLWWSKFLCWAFIVPIMSIFLYLLATINFPGVNEFTVGTDTALTELIRNSMQYIIMLGLLWGATYVSKYISCGVGAGIATRAIKLGRAGIGATGNLFGKGFAGLSGAAALRAKRLSDQSEQLRKAGRIGDADALARKAKWARAGAGVAAAGTLVSPAVVKSAVESFKEERKKSMQLPQAFGSDIGSRLAFGKGGNIANYQKRQVLAKEKSIKENGEDRDPQKILEGVEKAIKSGNATAFEAYMSIGASNKLLGDIIQGHNEKNNTSYIKNDRGLRRLVLDNESKLKLDPERRDNMLRSVATSAARLNQTEYVGADEADQKKAVTIQRSAIESMSPNEMAKLSATAFKTHLDAVMPNFTDQRSVNNIPISTIAEIVNDPEMLKNAFAQNQTGTLHMLEKLASLDNERLKITLDNTSKKAAKYENWDGLKTEMAKSIKVNTIDTKDFEKLAGRIGLRSSGGNGGPTIVVPPTTGENRRSRTVFPEDGGAPREE